MNKTIIININGIVFHIEEEAYDQLRTYMIDVKRHFGHSVDSHEIVGDIENRIAEMFSERLSAGKKEVITSLDVQEIIAQMGRVSDFSDETAGTEDANREAFYEPTYETIQRKLMRDMDDRFLGGVCSGLGHYFGMESRWVRLLFLLLFIFWGTGLLVYIILWIVVPAARTRADRMAMRGEAPNLQNFQRNFQEEMEGLRTNFSEGGGKARNFLDSVGHALTKVVVFLAKAIGVIFVAGICIGLITLIISIFASFELLGANREMAMFPLNVIEPEIRMNLLASALVVVAIPLIALIGIILRILFEKQFMGKYVNFTLFAIWLIAIGVTTVYAVRTAKGFRQESTIVEQMTLSSEPAYVLSLNDSRITHLVDSQATETGIRRRIRTINNDNFLDYNTISIRIVPVDSTDQPSVDYHFSSRGSTFEEASQHIERLTYRLEQNGGHLIFDSHPQIQQNELYRGQEVHLQLNIPVGTPLTISNELSRYLRDLPYRQCRNAFRGNHGAHYDRTIWMMTSQGLKCEE